MARAPENSDPDPLGIPLGAGPRTTADSASPSPRPGATPPIRGLRVIAGPPNSGRAGVVVDRFRELLADGPLLVVPTAGDVSEFERELTAFGGCVLGGSIVTFAGLVAEVGRATAAPLPSLLSDAERHALLRGAVAAARPRLLGEPATRPGFVPALDSLIAELGGAMVGASEFRLIAAGLERPTYETEIAAIYEAYERLRALTGRADAATATQAAIAELRADRDGWAGRPVLVYGFDDLTRAQRELIGALAEASEVTVAITYADTPALAARAGLLAKLDDEIGIAERVTLPFDPAYTTSATLRHLDRLLFEPDAATVNADGGLRLLECSGARGEAEAIAIEIAHLLRDGVLADEIVVVLRHPDSGGPLLASVLREHGLPVALEASAPVARTAVGTSVIELCRAAADDRAVESLLVHLRTDLSVPPGLVDRAERRVRRGEARTVAEVTEGWRIPPRHLERLRRAEGPAGRLAALARSARELAEGAHRDQAPLASEPGEGLGRGDAAVPFSALELRAAGAISELLSELARVGELEGCDEPDLGDAIAAIDSASVPLWRGPTSGRIRIMSPYRARAARARALFCASLGDGVFPSARPPDPLLSEERRRQIGNPDLRRAEQMDEERYLFHACVSRPTERLYICWQGADEEGGALARSPFVDEVCDLLAEQPESIGEPLLRRRGPERSLPAPAEATTPRALARALATAGYGADHGGALERLGVGGEAREATLALFADARDPGALPGPLSNPVVLGELAGRRTFSANSLEGWVTCSYKWFVEHELRPQRLEPQPDPLWLGSVVHAALEALYRDPPGSDSIPRAPDLGRWKARFAELLRASAVSREGTEPSRSRRVALERARIQVEAFLEAEAGAETALRPAVELLEASFGSFEDQEGEPGAGTRPALELGDGELRLRGRIDRIDLAPDGRTAVLHDYKTAKSVARADDFEKEGTLQIQLYMLVARRVLGLDPVAGLYHPLGSPSERRPRGLALSETDALEGIGMVGTDRKEREKFEAILASAEERAIAAAEAMRRGRIDRDPLGGKCPKYCTFQTICRLERGLEQLDEEAAPER